MDGRGPFPDRGPASRVDVRVRAAEIGDLPGIVTLYNHYVAHTSATFDTRLLRPEDRRGWFEDHSHGGPHRLLVAEDPEDGILG